MHRRGMDMQLILLILAAIAILVGIGLIIGFQGKFSGLLGGAFT